MGGLADDLRAAAQTWAEYTAQVQGLGPKVGEGEVLRSVALLLGAKPLGAPDGGESRRVEPVVAPPAGADDQVIEDGGDDLLLAG